jgi:hypothetical protein
LRRADYTLRFQVINLLDDKTMLRLNPAAYYDYGAQGPAIDDAFDRSVPFMPSLGVELHF